RQFLEEAIDQLFPATEISDAFTREDAAQSALVRNHTQSFIGEGFMEQALDRLLSTPLLLTGEPGAGKTATLANWVDRRQSGLSSGTGSSFLHRLVAFLHRLVGGSNASPVLVPVFVGASPESINWRFILRYLANTLVRRFQFSVVVPEQGRELIDA